MAERCAAAIWVRDTYRYCGGKRQFKMYYRRKHCSRRATHSEWCWQHKHGCNTRFDYMPRALPRLDLSEE